MRAWGSLSSDRMWLCGGQWSCRTTWDSPSSDFPQSLLLGMVASGSISKVQVNYADAAPPSAVLHIYVFVCFLQACKPRAVSCLPCPHPFLSLCQGSVASPVVASVARQCCRSATACVFLAMAKRRKGDLKELTAKTHRRGA